jgi:hypothetical protein
MGTRTKIVAQLVAGMIGAEAWKSYDYSEIVEIAVELADEIIKQTKVKQIK